MSRRRLKRMSNLFAIFKDKLSLFKATLHLSVNPTTVHRLAILRATTHFPLDPPPHTTVDDVIAIAHHYSSDVISTLLRRLHRTHSPHVAVKCLLTLHHILAREPHVNYTAHINNINIGSLKIKLSGSSDADTWEMCNWVRWYGGVLEQSVIVFKYLGYYLSHLTGQTKKTTKKERIKTETLLIQLGCLVSMVEQICRAPESLEYQRMGLIFEAMKLVGEDYRLIMREIMELITEIKGRIKELSDDQVKGLVIDLKRLVGCKEKVVLMFLNKKRNDGAWDLIHQMKVDMEIVSERRECGPSAIVPVTRGRRWLDVEWNSLVVSLA